jgi:8-oxo-dGTP diphosphatase
MQFYLAVKGIITRSDGKILVLKRSAHDDHKPNVWETPGGGMDTEESPQQALEREIKEETGLSVSIQEPFNVFAFKKDTGEFKVGITFICEYVDGEVSLSSEHSEYRWIEPHEFADLESVPSLHEEITNYSKSKLGGA